MKLLESYVDGDDGDDVRRRMIVQILQLCPMNEVGYFRRLDRPRNELRIERIVVVVVVVDVVFCPRLRSLVSHCHSLPSLRQFVAYACRLWYLLLLLELR